MAENNSALGLAILALGSKGGGGGGTPEGAILYNAAQSLTEEQQMQARANQSLPYTSYDSTNWVTNQEIVIDAAINNAMINLDFEVSAPRFSTYIITAKEVADGEVIDSIKGKINLVGPNGYFVNYTTEPSTGKVFVTDTSDTYTALNQMKFYCNEAEEARTIYVDVIYVQPVINNKLDVGYINSDLFSKLNYSNGYISTTDNQLDNKNNFVMGQGNTVSNDINGALVVGQNNFIANGCASIALIGQGNVNTCDSGTPLNTGTSFIGNFLNATQSVATFVTGQYNNGTSKVAPWTGMNSYNTGDLVTPMGQYFGRQVWKCLQDNVTGMPPNFGPKTDNEYWHLLTDAELNNLDKGYLFVIGNGVDGIRSNALTVDWNGNLVCNNIPEPPTTDGTYTLKCVISSGVATYSWVQG